MQLAITIIEGILVVVGFYWAFIEKKEKLLITKIIKSFVSKRLQHKINEATRRSFDKSAPPPPSQNMYELLVYFSSIKLCN